MKLIVLILFQLILSAAAFAEGIPPHTYLTWHKSDIVHTMTINFHSALEMETIKISYDTQSRGTALAQYTHTASGDSRALEKLKRRVHRIDLVGLTPLTTYYFIVSNGTKVLTPEYKFKTLPDGDAPLNFVQGGDFYVSEDVSTLHRLAAARNPMFALIGGDIAYDNGDITNVGLWDQWLARWQKDMVTAEGNLVPMILAIGNHEVQGHFRGSFEKSPFFPNYFSQDDGTTYFSRQLNAKTVLFVLDSGHIFSHGGAQTEWLKTEMEKYKSIPRKFAIYHVPLYPSVRVFTDEFSTEGRKHWLPVFDQNHMTAAFENHDHSLKRTKRLKDGKPDSTGTLYLGDGCWGQAPRKVDLGREYLDMAKNEKHFWSVKTLGTSTRFEAIGLKGEILDSYELKQ
jgi:hypothetical protein